MYAADDPPPLGASHLRIARPSRDLTRTERFWVSSLGLRVLERVQPQVRGEHELVILGWPCAWHPEPVSDPDGQTPPAPTEEDLLVLYLGQPVGDQLIARLAGAGGQLIPAPNPYWDRGGVTIADPDGYRLVLSHRDGSDHHAPARAEHPNRRRLADEPPRQDRSAERRVRARPKPRRQSRYVIRLPAILAEMCRIVHG